MEKVDEFVAKYQMTCPAALERIREGHPVIVRKKENTPKLIKDVVETFITYIDQLKLNVRAVDDLQPSLNDLYLSISAFPALPDDADSKVKVKKWLVSGEYFIYLIRTDLQTMASKKKSKIK